MYIVYKKLNGLVVTDLEWVFKKVHVTFIQELEIVIIESVGNTLLKNIFPFNTKI